MADYDLATLQRQIDASPQVQSWLQQYRQQARQGRTLRESGLNARNPAAEAGIELPEDYYIDPETGQLRQQGFLSRNPWVAPLAFGAGQLGAVLAGGTTAAASGMPALSSPASVLPAGGTGAIGASPAASAITASAAPASAAASSAPWWQEALQAGAPLGAAVVGRAMGDGAGSGSLPPELMELLSLAMQRMRAQEPLFEATNRQALAGLPSYARGGE